MGTRGVLFLFAGAREAWREALQVAGGAEGTAVSISLDLQCVASADSGAADREALSARWEEVQWAASSGACPFKCISPSASPSLMTS